MLVVFVMLWFGNDVCSVLVPHIEVIVCVGDESVSVLMASVIYPVTVAWPFVLYVPGSGKRQ